MFLINNPIVKKLGLDLLSYYNYAEVVKLQAQELVIEIEIEIELAARATLELNTFKEGKFLPADIENLIGTYNAPIKLIN